MGHRRGPGRTPHFNPIASVGLAAVVLVLAGASLVQADGSNGATIDAPPGRVRLLAGDAELKGRAALERSFGGATERRAILRFDGPLTDARRGALESAGVRVVQYLSDDAYVVRFPRQGAEAIADLDFVVGGADFSDAWKTSARFGERSFETPRRRAIASAGRALLRIHLFADAEEDEVRRVVEMLESRPRASYFGATRVGRNTVLSAEVDKGTVSTLSGLAAVQYIEHAPELHARNSSVQWILQSNVLDMRPLHDQGLTGLGQVVGVCDSGLDDEHCAFTNQPGKILAYNGTPNITEHGTHVAGAAVGAGSPANNLQGHAYDAGLVFSIEPAFTGTDLTSVLELQASQSARVHTNSWGDDDTDEYTGLARAVDAFMHDHEDNLVVFAATNGPTLASPENAKNCVSVVESQDTPNQDAAMCAGQPTASGLTSDGRLKPDVFAPGCGTLSAWAFTTCGTTSLSGTSMAAPAVAGIATLMRQYFVEGFYPSGAPDPGDALVPSGALLKACTVNSATGMGGIADLPGGASSFVGWGRVLADDALYFAGDARRLIVHDRRHAQGLETGSVAEFEFDALGNAEHLKITLAWSDAPGAPGAQLAWVNNLDLEVIAPSAVTYLGNNFMGGDSVPGGAHDPKNNLEQVHIAGAELGTWTVRVHGTNIPEGPQGFALVITGDVMAPPEPLTLSVTDAPSLIEPNDAGATVEVAIAENDDALIGGTVMLHYSYDGSPFASIPMSAGMDPGTFVGALPSASCGHTPEFYVSAEGVFSGVRTAPPGAPAGVLSAVVGQASELIAASEGFGSGLPASWSASGLWSITSACENLPLCSDAPWAYFGNPLSCGYATGFREQGFLTSRPYALPLLGPGERLTLRYCSSMDNENFTLYDRGMVHANGVLLEEAPHTGGAWETREIDISFLAGQAVVFDWEFDSVDSLVNNFGGWQVDDVEIVLTSVSCTDPCPGDVNGDGTVNVFDFAEYLTGFGASSGATRSDGDLDGDGDVDVLDFGLLASNFGALCP